MYASLRADLPAFRGIRTATRSGKAASARALLMGYFRDRRNRRFFVDPNRVRVLAERLAREHPDWQEHARSAAVNWQRYLYLDETGAGMPSKSLAWEDPPLGPGADTVHLHRAQHFVFAVQLARAQSYGASTTPDLKAAVDSWLEATQGRADSPAYLSPLLAVHRAFAITWCLTFLAAASEPDTDLEFALLRILLADARFVQSKLGRSFRNNHLLADAFLMFYLGMLYPEFKHANAWRRKGEMLFLRELERQTYEDGSSFEHSVHYHEFVCEMVTAIVLVARRNQIPLAAWVLERHRRMLEFQASLAGQEASGVPIGDTVELCLCALDAFDGVGAASHREILRALYEPDFPASRPNAPGLERAAWMLDGELVPASQSIRHTERPIAYPQGGFVVMPDTALNGTLLFRTGPAPDLPCNPGHMHADLLSIYLRVGGVPVVVEPGTYTYRAEPERWPADEPEWRAYFLGPAAHNGLCIKGQDPLGRVPSDFPWGALKSRVETEFAVGENGLTWAEGSVVGDTGYTGHTRGVLHVEGVYWLVYDRLPFDALNNDAWLSLQFSAQASITVEGPHSLSVITPASRLRVTSSESAQPMRLMKGERDPTAGWLSTRYGLLEPAFAMQIPTTAGPPVVATLFNPLAVSAPCKVEIDTGELGAIGLRISCNERIDYVLVPEGAQNQTASLYGVSFRGTALWLRTALGRATEVRAVGGYEVRADHLGLSLTSVAAPEPQHL